MKTHMRSGALAALLAVTTLSGCATATNPKDPFEGFNRAMFGFNDAVDKVAFKPAATIYSKVVPGFVQTGVGNFFGNLADVWTMVNNMLQGKMADGLSDMMRVAVNSTLGLGGVLDIGSEAGMAKHKEDFGQTLGKWGVKGGPYVVLPIFGSFTLRDSLAFPLDFKGDPWGYKTPVRWRNVGTVLRLVDKRAAVLDASSLIEEAALDKYEFVRDAFLQRRANQIYDGESAPKDKSSLNHDSQDDDSAYTQQEAEAAETSAAASEAAAATARATAAATEPRGRSGVESVTPAKPADAAVKKDGQEQVSGRERQVRQPPVVLPASSVTTDQTLMVEAKPSSDL
ncbi:VacJ family lipoprotein [Undibacterium arcticum]|uniref:VacJ family lipoprotein n=1 Tax=Undibacterium arcticum TaxID=1762892 RepID=A0ABV7FAF5_9BURK